MKHIKLAILALIFAGGTLISDPDQPSFPREIGCIGVSGGC